MLKKDRIHANYGEYIRDEILRNLLTAHKRLAETGSAKEVVLLSKVILKLSDKFDDKVLQLGLVERQEDYGSPPDDGKDNV